jgi:hypothetical protein
MNLEKVFNTKFLIVSGIILFAALMRLVPHYPNFTPVAAVALFGGAHINKKWLAFLIPVTALLLSDLLLGFHRFMIPVYISFTMVVLLGTILKGKISVGGVFLASISSSLLFYLITNFFVWVGSPAFYDQTISGLMQCYIVAIPFFHTTLLGDLFYSTVLFGGFYMLQSRYPVLQTINR